MDTVFLAIQREERIRGFLLVFPYSPTSVICNVFFPFPYGKRKGREVLTRMIKVRKTVNRFRYGREYLYYIGKKSNQWLHQHEVTLFHFTLLEQLNKGEKVKFYRREYNYPGGRADALYVILDNAGGGVKFFLEMDDMQNEFTKIKQYEDYFTSRVWVKENWADPLGKGIPKFPLILIVTRREIPDSKRLKVLTCPKGSNYREVLKGGK